MIRAAGSARTDITTALATLEVPDDPPLSTVPVARPHTLQQVITGLVVFGPLLAVGFAVVRFWGHGVSAHDVMLGAVLYAVTGHGVTVGYHRLFAHRSFKASRTLKIALAVAGSLAFQGALIGWVSNHRLHHAHSDREGDPHSPALSGNGPGSQLRGLWHAHMGWFFGSPPTSEQFVTDLLADADLRVVSRLFPLWCLLTLTIPFGLGWAWGGRLSAGVSALLWAGAVRICLLHHVTWSVNSVCHAFGRRPFLTGDRSTNVPALALVSMGESWHNAHHAFPTLARHGVDRWQWDSSAALIRLFELVGWSRDVHWPDPARLDRRRLAAGATRRPAPPRVVP